MGAGGRMKQKITRDPYGNGAWDLTRSCRCYAHLCLSQDWRRITGALPPHNPPTAAAYTNAGLPWFDYEANAPALSGDTVLSGVKSVGEIVGEKTGLEVPNNESVAPHNVVALKQN